MNSNSIKKALDDKSIIIHPFNHENLNENSYDVTLGIYYYVITNNQKNLLINPHSKQNIKSNFEGYFRAKTIKELPNLSIETDTLGLSEKTMIIPLLAGQTILVNTQEFIGSLKPFSFNITPIDYLSKMGIHIQNVDCDANIISRWSLAITNLNNRNVILIPGNKIATLKFFQDNIEEYSNHLKSIDPIIKSWKPEDILPIPNCKQLPCIEVKNFIEKRKLVENQIEFNLTQKEPSKIKKYDPKKPLKIPEPKRDKEGKPIIPEELKPIDTKTLSGEEYKLPQILDYNPLNL